MRRLTIVERLILIGMFALVVAVLIPTRGRRPEYDTPSGMTGLNLKITAGCIYDYYLKSNRYPYLDSWKSDIKPCLENQRYGDPSIDGWGNPIQFCQDSVEEFYIYSFGKNGEDDGMNGDDRVFPLDIEDWSTEPITYFTTNG